jgi:hypothetical protein
VIAILRSKVGSTPFWHAQSEETAVEQRGLDQRHRDKNGEIGKKHGNTLVRTLRKVYGTTFAAGQAETAKLGDVLQYLNDTSLSQLVHDHKNGHLEKKIKQAEK